MYLGTWQIDDLLTFPANTHTASTGAATDADSVPTYRVYEDETTTPILTGSMAKLDDANTTGFYSEQITLSAANGFEVGKCYTVYVSATVSSVTGTLSHTFQVEVALATAASVAALSIPTVADILAGVIEGSITLKGALRLALSALTGKASGGGTTTVIFRDTGDTKARITATVTAAGDRTAVTRDITD